METTETPTTAKILAKGVVAVLSAPDGRFTVSATDFQKSTPGGFTLRQSQERRAEETLARKLVEETCSPFIAKALQGYDAERLLQRLVMDQGFSMSIIPVGHDDDSNN